MDFCGAWDFASCDKHSDLGSCELTNSMVDIRDFNDTMSDTFTEYEMGTPTTARLPAFESGAAVSAPLQVWELVRDVCYVALEFQAALLFVCHTSTT